MSIFEHASFGNPKDVDVNPYVLQCIYCQEILLGYDLETDVWEITDEELLSVHEETALAYKEIHGLEDGYLNLNLDTKRSEIWLNCCNTCGWWRLIKQVTIWAEVWQIWNIFFGCTGVLKNLKLNNISIPIDDVSIYLIAKYESRFSINPRLFEDVVASVFKGIGYHAYVTGYSNDGGIDIVLGNSSGDMVGVQVKRYKNKIKVEQIRAFAGALMLSGQSRGIFVTTSDFQPGAFAAADKFSSKTLPIELINANKFYEALKISQKATVDVNEIKAIIKKENISKLFSYGWDTPERSL